MKKSPRLCKYCGKPTREHFTACGGFRPPVHDQKEYDAVMAEMPGPEDSRWSENRRPTKKKIKVGSHVKWLEDAGSEPGDFSENRGEVIAIEGDVLVVESLFAEEPERIKAKYVTLIPSPRQLRNLAHARAVLAAKRARKRRK